ncbi:hypothetical protein ABI59_02765 [Acidobacteria bacterium Mor1]|nr:hypothetical protein ABI59_02765 [Acidobacteria bacterium Mor1]
MRSMLLVLVLTFAALTGPLQAADEADSIAALDLAMRTARSIPERAQLLVDHAWPLDVTRDDEVVRFARKELIQYGEHGMDAMARRIREVAKEQTSEILVTMIAARQNTEATPSGYIVGLDAALWFGNVEAKRYAIEQIGLGRVSGQMLAIVDAALEHPELTETAVRTLARLKNERARFYLNDLLRGDDSEVRDLAAEGLAAIGGEALSLLREAMGDPSVEVREASARAVLQIASVADLSTLHDYYGGFPDDDPDLREMVRERALLLEKLLEAHETGSDAVPTPN